jgi:hypothetical protein
VNEKLQVVDADGKAIPGPYLAGNTLVKRFGEIYNNLVPGPSNGMACTLGYHAWKNATAGKRGES